MNKYNTHTSARVYCSTRRPELVFSAGKRAWDGELARSDDRLILLSWNNWFVCSIYRYLNRESPADIRPISAHPTQIAQIDAGNYVRRGSLPTQNWPISQDTDRSQKKSEKMRVFVSTPLQSSIFFVEPSLAALDNHEISERKSEPLDKSFTSHAKLRERGNRTVF